MPCLQVTPTNGLSVRPIGPLSHSLSAPTFSNNCFSNTTYSYSYAFQSTTPNVTTREDIQRLVTNGRHSVQNNLVTKTKESNNDLIDLIDAIESKDVLQLFDPLLIENNNLNFSNNFELDSESSANDDSETPSEEPLSVSLAFCSIV